MLFHGGSWQVSEWLSGPAFPLPEHLSLVALSAREPEVIKILEYFDRRVTTDAGRVAEDLGIERAFGRKRGNLLRQGINRSGKEVAVGTHPDQGPGFGESLKFTCQLYLWARKDFREVADGWGLRDLKQW